MGAGSSGDEDIAGRHQRALAACKGYTDKFPQVPPITFEQLTAHRTAGVPLLLVDVRSDPEQRVSMVAGALRKEDFEATLNANQVQPNTVRTLLGIASWTAAVAAVLLVTAAVLLVTAAVAVLLVTAAVLLVTAAVLLVHCCSAAELLQWLLAD